MSRINSTVDDRVIIPNDVIVDDGAVVVDLRCLCSRDAMSVIVSTAEIGGWRPTIVRGAKTEAEANPNCVPSPSEPNPATPSATRR